MSLKDVPVRARLWAPDRSLPRFFGRLLLFLSDSTLRLLPSTFGRWKRAEVSLKRAALHTRATKMYESVARESRAVPSGNDKYGFRCRRVSFIHTSFCPAPLGNGKARKCCPSVSCCTLGRRKCSEVSPKRAVFYSWATKSMGFVAEESHSSLRHSALHPRATKMDGSVA